MEIVELPIETLKEAPWNANQIDEARQNAQGDIPFGEGNFGLRGLAPFPSQKPESEPQEGRGFAGEERDGFGAGEFGLRMTRG